MQSGVMAINSTLLSTQQTLRIYKTNQLKLEEGFQRLETISRQRQRKLNQSLIDMENRIKSVIEKNHAENSQMMQNFNKQLLKRFDKGQLSIQSDRNQHSQKMQKLYKIVGLQAKLINQLTQGVDKTERNICIQKVYLRQRFQSKDRAFQKTQRITVSDNNTISHLQKQLNEEKKKISSKLRDFQQNILNRIEVLQEKMWRLELT